MPTDFDAVIDRRGTSCLKYDFAVERGYPQGILPFWVADMDFRTPQPVIEELTRRVQPWCFVIQSTMVCLYDSFGSV